MGTYKRPACTEKLSLRLTTNQYRYLEKLSPKNLSYVIRLLIDRQIEQSKNKTKTVYIVNDKLNERGLMVFDTKDKAEKYIEHWDKPNKFKPMSILQTDIQI